MLALALLLAGSPADDLPGVVGRAVLPLVFGHKHAAVAVGVWQAGRPRVFGYGVARTRLGKAAPDGRTVFAIGSITKTFTGVLLAEAVRRGEVALDDSANDHLPAALRVPAKGDKAVTLGQLATHRSGLPVQPPALLLGLTGEERNPFCGFDRKWLGVALAGIRPAAPPGEKFDYSNLGAGLAGEAVAHAAGAASYDWLLKERVCRPLGLWDTAEALTGDQSARLAEGFTADGEPGPHWEFASLTGCGGLFSTADDLLRYAAASMAPPPAPLARTFALATAPRADAGGDRVGLFWFTKPRPGRPAFVWHNGGTPVARAVLVTVPAERLAVVVLSARRDDRVDEVGFGLASALLSAPPKAP